MVSQMKLINNDFYWSCNKKPFSIGDKSSNPDSDFEFRFYTFMRKLLGIYWIESDIKKWNVAPVDEMSCLCSVVQPQDD